MSEQVAVLKDNELKEYLNRFRGRIPSVLLDDLYNKLKGKGVTRDQVNKIIKKIEENLSNAKKIDEIFRKLENIESMIRQRMKEEKERAEMERERREAKTEPLPEILQQQQQPQPQQPQPQQQTIQHYAQQPQQVQQVQVQQPQQMMDFETPALLPFIEPTEEPRLKEVPLNDTRCIMILLKWIEFMLERVGYEGLKDLLNYYVDINWISDKVLFTVLRYAKGIKLYHENSDWRPVGYMNVKDHITSLLFIEALRTGRFNKDMVMKVEREIYTIRKEVSEINGL